MSKLFVRPQTTPVSVAVRNLTDSIKWYVINDYDLSTFVWEDEDTPRPSDEAIIAKQQSMWSEIQLAELRAARAKEYPSIGDQLDALFHAGVFPAEMTALIQTVKDKYPKGDIL